MNQDFNLNPLEAPQTRPLQWRLLGPWMPLRGTSKSGRDPSGAVV